MRAFLGLVAVALSPGCLPEVGCAQCPYDRVTVALVDVHGAPAIARGQWRAEGDPEPDYSFNCAPTPAGALGKAYCTDGAIVLPGLAEYQVRFELEDGGWSEWQDVRIPPSTATVREDPRGACLPCNYWDLNAEPLVVPVDAWQPEDE